MGTLSKAAGELRRVRLRLVRADRLAGEPRPEPDVLDRPAAGFGRRAPRRRCGSSATIRTLRARPLANARRFTAALGRPPAESPIVPVILGEPERALAASAMLEKHGLLVVAIRPPSVPPGTARLRFAFSAMHEPEPIDRAAALLKEHQYA